MNTPILPSTITTIAMSIFAWLGITFSMPSNIDPALLPLTASPAESLEVVVGRAHPDSHRRGRLVPSTAYSVELPDPDDREAHPVNTLILDLAKPDAAATFASR
jgi:hypothetical protein